MKQKEGRTNAIEKALLILLAFKDEQNTWGVRDLSAHLGFSPATVLRILQTLKAHDFITQDHQSKKYRLGNVYFGFFQTLLNANPVTQAVFPFLEKLRDRTRETVHFNVIQGDERVCVNSLDSQQNLKGSMPVGDRSPLHAGASPKCLLAFSPPAVIETYLNQAALTPITENTIVNKNQLRLEISEIKALGYAVSLGERSPGLGSLSAPVLNYKGDLLGCISLAIPEIRFKDYDHRKFCIESLLEIAMLTSKSLGYHEPTGDS